MAIPPEHFEHHIQPDNGLNLPELNQQSHQSAPQNHQTAPQNHHSASQNHQSAPQIHQSVPQSNLPPSQSNIPPSQSHLPHLQSHEPIDNHQVDNHNPSTENIVASLEKVVETKLIQDDKGAILRYYRVQWTTWISEESLKRNYESLITNFWKEKEEERKRGEMRVRRQRKDDETRRKRLLKQQQKQQLAKQTNNQSLSVFLNPNLPNVGTNLQNDSTATPILSTDHTSIHNTNPALSTDPTAQAPRLSTGSTLEEGEYPGTTADKEDNYRLQLETEDDPLEKEDDDDPNKIESNGKPKIGREISCKDCGTTFNNSYYKDKCRFCSNTCRECGKQFKRPSALRNHVEGVHEKNKKHRCDICGKLFTTRHYLTNHILKHKPDRNYECDICHKRYKDVTKLKRHRLIHSGVKPFKCQICQREFQQKEALKKHMLLHTEGPRRFQCLLCKKGFNHKVSLKSHMLKHHDKNEQQAAVMIGLWKKYQQTEAGFDNMVQTDVLSKALNDVVMVPQESATTSSDAAGTSSSGATVPSADQDINPSLSMINFGQSLGLS